MKGGEYETHRNMSEAAFGMAQDMHRLNQGEGLQERNRAIYEAVEQLCCLASLRQDSKTVYYFLQLDPNSAALSSSSPSQFAGHRLLKYERICTH